MSSVKQSYGFCRTCRRTYSKATSHRCPTCSQVSTSRSKFYKPYAISICDFETADITGELTRITSRKHERELCEKHGVSPRSDWNETLAKPAQKIGQEEDIQLAKDMAADEQSGEASFT